MIISRFFLIMLLTAGVVAGAARAGPPYLADDPQPTDLGKWEIYAFTGGSGGAGAFDGAAGIDLNYGLLPGVQLTATLPVAVGIESGRVRSGRGDIELGLKYRFLHSEHEGIDLAIFPRVILPTGGRRFGTGRVRLLLPVWAQKDFGPWSLFGGGGLTLNPGAGNRDFWETGVALTRTVTPRLSLGAEIAHQGPDAVGARADDGAQCRRHLPPAGAFFAALLRRAELHPRRRDGIQCLSRARCELLNSRRLQAPMDMLRAQG